MSRPPKPTVLLEMSGALKHDKKRYAKRGAEPRPTGGIGPPPGHWALPSSFPKGALAAIWREYVKEAPPGLLTISDRKLLEIVCLQTYEARRIGVKTAARAQAELVKSLAKFGMNPTDRARMTLPKEAPKAGKLEQFAQRKQAG